MKSSFKAFMNGLIDYAGLFPPARLDLKIAIANFIRYRQEPLAWMLGRFIIPAARLHELEAFRGELLEPGLPPFRVSVLLSNAAREGEALEKLEEDARSLDEFLLSFGDRASVEAFEIRLPEETAAAAVAARSVAFLRACAQRLNIRAQRLSTCAHQASANGSTHPEGDPDQGPELFVEAPLVENQDEVDAATVAALADLGIDLADLGRNLALSGRGLAGGKGAGRLSRAGYKLRCGGLDAQAIPAPARVAALIAGCRDRGVPLKCTAGLHHPLRHFASDVSAMNHGFFNLFGAGILARARNWTEERIEACLSDEQAEHFRFDEEGFAWQDERVSTQEVKEGRQFFVTGFGSCSFDEPREDLAALGLLD